MQRGVRLAGNDIIWSQSSGSAHREPPEKTSRMLGLAEYRTMLRHVDRDPPGTAHAKHRVYGEFEAVFTS